MNSAAITAAASLLAHSDADLGDEREILTVLSWYLPAEPGPAMLDRITNKARVMRAGCIEVELA